MKAALSIVSLAVVAALAGCGGEGAGASPAGTGSAAAQATGDAKPAGDAAAAPAKTSAAASFPAQALPEPFTTLTLGVPPGAKLEKGVTGDYAMIEAADYAFKIEEAKDTDVAKLKEFLSKGGATYIVDRPEGIVSELPQKGGGKEYMVLRYVKVGETSYKCETTMKGAPRSAEKAQEAFDACGTLAAK